MINLLDFLEHPLWITRDVRILVVVDGPISTIAGPNEFGVGRVVDLIDGMRRSCVRFEVDTARRAPYDRSRDPAVNLAQNAGHVSTSFRFDDENGDGSRVLDDYQQVWLFGFEREDVPGPDADELAVLTEWMDRGNGVFATGDHEDLGASLASGIPCVRGMRRWTAADGVPPQGALGDPNTRFRLDTNRPTNPAERLGMAPIHFDHEEDATPQSIEWVPDRSARIGFLLTEAPHEILCHPSDGPIDVMPDHPHEGRTRSRNEIDAGATYDFGNGRSGDDFPSNGTTQPLPELAERPFPDPLCLSCPPMPLVGDAFFEGVLRGGVEAMAATADLEIDEDTPPEELAEIAERADAIVREQIGSSVARFARRRLDALDEDRRLWSTVADG